MATVTDDFNRANSANLGANWTRRRTGTSAELGITSNACSNNSGGDDDVSSYNAGGIGADQYAQVIAQSLSANSIYCASAVRCNGTGSGFGAYVIATDGNSGSGHTEIAKYVSDSYSVLAAVATTVAVNDVIKIEATGSGGSSSIKAYKNGAQIGSTITGDTSHSTGEPGVDIYGSGHVDDFEAGDVGGGGAGDPAAAGFRSLLGVGK